MISALLIFRFHTFLITLIDFKTINKVEEFLLYHEIRHIDNRETLRYTSFKNKIDEEIDCNLFSLNELQKSLKLA